MEAKRKPYYARVRILVPSAPEQPVPASPVIPLQHKDKEWLARIAELQKAHEAEALKKQMEEPHKWSLLIKSDCCPLQKCARLTKAADFGIQ